MPAKIIKSPKYFFILLFLLSFLILEALPLKNAKSIQKAELQNQNVFDYVSIINEIREDKIREHIKFFSSLGSRFTGYEGCNIAALYILERFKEYKLENVRLEPFNLTIPVDYGANITVLSPSHHVIKAYPLLPNSVQTCSTPKDGIQGRLIFGGSGRLEDFNGKEVNGSIVLMNFNCQRNWLNAVKLGAKCIIFIEPEYTTNIESSLKILNVPLNIPRLYITKKDAELLLNLLNKGNVTVNVKSRMKYEIRTGYNVVGIVKGTSINETIAVSAHYDSFSYIPSLAPGADDSCGISVLLELARYLALNPPKKNVMFVAFSGFWQGLYGSREFLDKHWDEFTVNIKALFNFDFSTDESTIGLPYIGYWYHWEELAWALGPQDRLNENVRKILQVYLPEIEKQLNVKINVDRYTLSSEWQRTIPTTYMLDTEPIMFAGGLGVAFRTVHSMREVWGTPLDTYDRVNYENLRPQMIFSICSFVSFVNEDAPLETYEISRLSPYAAFATLQGHVVEYNASSGRYSPVPDAIVHISLAQAISLGASIQNLIIKTDENGVFTIKGIAPQMHPEAGQMYLYTVYAYKIDPETGEITYAIDLGPFGAGKFPNSFYIYKAFEDKYIVVFRCGNIVTFDNLNPQLFVQATNFEIKVIPSHVTPEHYGFVTDDQISIYFVPTRKPVEIIVKDRFYFPLMILINASEKFPEGLGFTVNAGTTLHIYNTAIKVAQDLYYLNSLRLKNAEESGVKNLEALNINESVGKDICESQLAYRKMQYDVAYSRAFAAWQKEIKIYRLTLDLINQASSTIVIIFLLLLPFSFIAERLVFNFTGRKRAITIIAILFSCLFILYLARLPSFTLATSVPMSLLGTSIVALTIPIAVILIQYAVSFFKKLRKKIIGAHFVEMRRYDTLMIAISVGISNMKKRKIRTLMTLLTLIIVTWSMVSFTSMSPYTVSRVQAIPGTTRYNGILLRRITWDPLSPQILDFISSGVKKDKIVSPRYWFFPRMKSLTISSDQISIELVQSASILGFSPYEINVTNLANILTRGRWFNESDLKSCIISEWLANQLSVNVNDSISISGIQLKIVGIFEGKNLFSVLDLDGYPLVPITYAGEGIGIQLNPPNSTIIVPAKFARILGSSIYTMAIKFFDPTEINEYASELALFTGLDVYAGINGTITVYRKTQVFSTHGWENLIILLILSMLIVTNTMLAIINERKREIAILSSLGLSPTDVVFMFAAEAITFAFVGGIVGYLMGVVTNIALYNLNLLPPGFTMNASSSYVAIAMGLIMLSVLFPLPYILRLSGRLVTPSVERKWKIPTKPKGDQWIIPTPFVLKDKMEAIALLLFIKEYCEAHRTERAGVFVADDISLGEEKDAPYLYMKARIVPFDAGILQEVQIIGNPVEKEGYSLLIKIKRITGLLSVWSRTNRLFINEIRKQFLLWRTGLSPREKTKYLDLARSIKFGKRETYKN